MDLLASYRNPLRQVNAGTNLSCPQQTVAADSVLLFNSSGILGGGIHSNDLSVDSDNGSDYSTVYADAHPEFSRNMQSEGDESHAAEVANA